MSVAVILLALRLLSALLLLAFLGLIGWLIYRDIRTLTAEASARQRQFGWLRVVAGPDGSSKQAADGGNEAQPAVYPLLPVTSIGRAPSNTIVLDDSYASSEHALISLRGRQWWLEDLGSRNGTLLNGLPLKEAVVISVGDIVTVGNTHLKVEYE
ncbi:MAG: FHA domain-containing protein [Chloroflexota bacterium]